VSSIGAPFLGYRHLSLLHKEQSTNSSRVIRPSKPKNGDPRYCGVVARPIGACLGGRAKALTYSTPSTTRASNGTLQALSAKRFVTPSVRQTPPQPPTTSQHRGKPLQILKKPLANITQKKKPTRQ